MNSKNDEKIEKLLEALRHFNLDLNWIIAVASLSAQEIAVKKKLNELGVSDLEEDFQKLCGRLLNSMKNQNLDTPDILLSISRSYRPIRAKILHTVPKSQLHPSEVEAILNNTIALTDVFFKKDLTKPIAEGLSVAVFVDDISKKSLDEQTKTFFGFPADTKRIIFDVLMDEVSLIKLNEVRSNENLFAFIENVVKLEGNLDLQLEFCEKLLKRTFWGTSIESKERLLQIIMEITKLDRVKKLIKEKNFVNGILVEFETSSSFNLASLNTSIMLNIATMLNGEQIDRVIDAIISNNQIHYSWGARSSLGRFISIHRDKIPKEKIKRTEVLLS
jgi:hypothetical protein